MQGYADSIAFLGQWGLFQKVVFFLLCASVVSNGFGAFTLVFLTETPRHHCLVPEVNLSDHWRNVTVPVQVVNGKEELSRCSRYRLDVIRNLSALGYVPNQDVVLADLEQEACVDGWSYNTDIYQSTVVTEFDLVCGDEWKQPFTSTVFFMGSLCGSFLSGQLSDRFGRKPVLFATIVVQSLCTFLQLFSTSWLMFIIFLFLNGLGQVSNFVAALVLGAETLTGNVRVLYSSLGTCFGFALGYMMLPLCAYFLRDWRHLLLALALLGVSYLPFWWLIPESPRWLLSQGRVEDAEAIMRKAAKWNKCQAPANIFGDYYVEKTDLKDKSSVFHLIRTSNIRITTLTLSLVAFTTTTGYFAISFNTPYLHSDPFVSCFISALTEVPAYISSWLALLYLPRRFALIGSLLIAAVPLFFIQLVPQDLSLLSITLEMLGKYGITIGTSMMFAVTAELYPTPLRNTATGTTGTISRIGSCVAPPLLKLRIYFEYLPYLILGTLSVLCAFATLFLPESFKQPLPETIEQMQRGKRVKCPCTGEKTKNNSKETHRSSTGII